MRVFKDTARRPDERDSLRESAVLEALAYLSDLHPDDEHDGLLIGARWYPRWRLEELADKYREPADHA